MIAVTGDRLIVRIADEGDGWILCDNLSTSGNRFGKTGWVPLSYVGPNPESKLSGSPIHLEEVS